MLARKDLCVFFCPSLLDVVERLTIESIESMTCLFLDAKCLCDGLTIDDDSIDSILVPAAAVIPGFTVEILCNECIMSLGCC